MRSCPGCAYLVPEAWSQCKRCGAALGPVVAAVAAHGPTHHATAAAAVVGAPVYRSASFAPPSTRAPVADLRPTDRGEGRRVRLEPGVEPRRRHRFSVTAIAAVIVIGAGGWGAGKRVGPPPGPPGLKPWPRGGPGVT